MPQKSDINLSISSNPNEPQLDLKPIDSGTPQLDLKPIGSPSGEQPKEEESLLSKGYHMFADPLTDLPSRMGKKFSDYVTDPNQALFGMHPTGQGGMHDYMAERLAMLRGFSGGAMQGLGDIASSLTSPASLITAGLSAGEVGAAKTGYTGLAKAAGLGAKISGAPMVIHGGYKALAPESSLEERGQGLVEAAGGAQGMFHVPATHGIGESPIQPHEEMPIKPGIRNVGHGNIPEGVEDPFEGMSQKEKDNFKQYMIGAAQAPDDISSEGPQMMRVPRKGALEGELPNVAMGGASPRVLDVLGTSLYSKERPVVTAKELLQNAFDEHRIIGQTEPIRVVTDSAAKDPISGTEGRSISVRDRGRGLTPEQLYTVFSNVGETGKGGESSASGGFGFAKAAPFLGGKSVVIKSVVDEGGQRVRYQFEGTPANLKNQEVGVPLTREVVDNKIPTGLEVTTHFDSNVRGMYNAEDFIKNITERSPSITSDVIHAKAYGTSQKNIDEFLNETPENPMSKYNTFKTGVDVKRYTKQPVPTLQDSLTTPGADLAIHYNEPEKGSQASNYDIHLMNKGLYQQTIEGSYGDTVPNVPRSIVADIKATVEEGHPSGDYPFTANREQINTNVTKAIAKWIDENIVSGAQKKRVEALQKMYDGIGLLHPEGPTDISYLDESGQLKPEEIKAIADSPALTKALTTLEQTHHSILNTADTLDWAIKPSDRLKKFGLLFQAPDKKGTTLGIHIPRADDPNDSAILVNLFEHLNAVALHTDPLDRLATGLFTTLTHEDAHIPGGSHDQGFAYRHAALLEKLGRKNTNQYLDQLGEAFNDGQGGINPEIQKLLQIYNESRGRETSGNNALIATGVNEQRPPNTTGRQESNVGGDDTGGERTRASKGVVDPYEKYRQVPVGTKYQFSPGDMNRGKMLDAIKLGFQFDGMSDAGKIKMSKVRESPPMEAMKDPNLERSTLAEFANLPRTLMATMDVSAPLRQGLGLIHKKAFWTALPAMFKAFGSEQFYNQAMDEIASKPLFQRSVSASGKIIPSFAEKAGLKLTNLLNNREESIMSSLLDKVPGIGGSERAYTLFLNKLRADTFEQMTKDFGVMSGDKPNIHVASQIADFVNNASGRGSMVISNPVTGKQYMGLERSANALSTVLFSPRLIASRLQMMGRGVRGAFDPQVYMSSAPNIRREYVKSLFAVAATASTFAQLARLGGATVESDPASADFGKVKMGNTRIDPYGGFQQYIVLAQRMMPQLDLSSMGLENIGGKMKSTVSDKEYSLDDPGFGRSNRADILSKFIRSKTNPIVNFAWGMLAGQREAGGKKMDLTTMNPYENAIGQRFIPMFTQDIYDLINDETTGPAEKGLATFMAGLGAGVQTYGSERQR